MATLDRLAPPAPAPVATIWSPRRAIAIVLTVATTIALLQVAQSSSFAHTGQKLQQLEAQRTDLNAQIHQLEADVAALSSLDRTERAARDRLGMVPALNRLDYITVDVQSPSGPLLPRPILEPAPLQTDTEPWWQSLLRVLPFQR